MKTPILTCSTLKINNSNDQLACFFLKKRTLLTFSNSRGGASGNKLKMTLGLPVYVLPQFRPESVPEPPESGTAQESRYSWRVLAALQHWFTTAEQCFYVEKRE